MEFSRSEYWSGLPFPPPGDLPKPGIEPGSPALQADSLPAELQGKPIEWHTCAQSLSHIQLFATPWIAARQAPLSMGFSRQEDRSGLPFPPPGDLPDPGIESESPVFPALAGGFFTIEPPGKPCLSRVSQ